MHVKQAVHRVHHLPEVAKWQKTKRNKKISLKCNKYFIELFTKQVLYLSRKTQFSTKDVAFKLSSEIFACFLHIF